MIKDPSHTLLEDLFIDFSLQKDSSFFLAEILKSAVSLTCADLGVIYVVEEENLLPALHFCHSLPASRVVFHKRPLVHAVCNIEDAYLLEGFDKRFDERHGYRTRSMLLAPMRGQEGEIIGAIQLINAHDCDTNKIHPFSEEDQFLILSLASQAALALNNAKLLDELKTFLQAMLGLIAFAVDEKSPMTGHHSRNVPLICEMLARSLQRFSEEEIEELKIAAFLHDCGKLMIPDHLLDKHTKLEAVVDRIEWIKTRFEVLRKDAYIAFLEKKTTREEYEKAVQTLDSELHFLEDCNQQKVSDPKKVQEIAKHVGLLSENEVENLSIESGNLTAKERKLIEAHALFTHKILSAFSFPKHLKQVPLIASSHHERMDGKGYPCGYKGEQIPLQARILAIADIFEALAAKDRPYKRALTLPEIYAILAEKASTGHLDKELVDVFIREDMGAKWLRGN